MSWGSASARAAQFGSAGMSLWVITPPVPGPMYWAYSWGIPGICDGSYVWPLMNCAARADADPQLIYSSYNPPPTTGGNGTGCPSAPGGIGKDHVGPIALGDTERTVRQRLGPPYSVNRGFLRYCLSAGGRLLVGELEDRSGELGESPDARAVILLTTSRALATKGVAAGESSSELRRHFPHARKKLTVEGTTVRVLRKGTGLIAGVRRGRVRWLGVYDRGAVHKTRTLRALLSRAG